MATGAAPRKMCREQEKPDSPYIIIGGKKYHHRFKHQEKLFQFEKPADYFVILINQTQINSFA
jgi:hypothetical protein